MSNIDLTGVYNIQRNYLSNLGGLGPDPEVAGYYSDIQTQLDTNYANYVAADRSVSDILTAQRDMKNIVDIEKARLDKKRAEINDQISSQERLMHFNKSHNHRYYQYTRIAVNITVALALFIGLSILGQYFPIIPDMILTVLSVIIISYALISSYMIYRDIQSRDLMDFDKYAGGPAPIKADLSGNAVKIKNAREKSASMGDLLGSINLNGCIGSDCCDEGTEWNSKKATCVPIVPGAKQGFTSLDKAYVTGEYKGNAFVKGNAVPNSPNEFLKYSKI